MSKKQRGARTRLPAGQTTLADLLFSQGFGTRRDCEALAFSGAVRIGGAVVDDPEAAVAADGLAFSVDGQPWVAQTRALVLLHKPAGHECSQRPSAWPSVLQLLPAPLRRRGLQSVGRLDQDTTGLLLLTDDGPLIHRLTSPKHHVPKVYEAITARPLDADQLQQLLDGVLLHDDPLPVRADACRILDEQRLEMTLTQGRYHQVKRMIAAVGNHCETLHRSRFGGLDLANAPQPGQWHFVDNDTRANALSS